MDESHDQTNVVCHHDHHEVLHEEHRDQTYEDDHHGRHVGDVNRDQSCEVDESRDRNCAVDESHDQTNVVCHHDHREVLHEERRDQTYEDDHHGRHEVGVNRDRSCEVDESHDLHVVLHEVHHDQTYEDDHHGHHEADANHDQKSEEDGRLPHENPHEVGVSCRRDENRQSDVGLTLYRGGLSCLDVQT